MANRPAPSISPVGSSFPDDMLSVGHLGAQQRSSASDFRDPENPRLVFLHGGWGGEHEDLMYGMLPLAVEPRLTFYDQRGSLRSPCDELPTAADHVADLEALRRALGEERLVLAGHSMGTWLGMAYAEAHPDRVAGLVAPVWPTPDAPGVDAPPRWERPEVAAELARHGLELPRRRCAPTTTSGPRSRNSRRAVFRYW